jgi:endoglucanase
MDTPDAIKEKHGDIGLGYGPVISLGSSCNKKLNEILFKVAEKNKIPYQVEANPRYTGTDGDVIFKMLGGIPTTVVSIPLRYMHTPVEVGDLDDILNTIKLLTAFCREDK